MARPSRIGRVERKSRAGKAFQMTGIQKAERARNVIGGQSDYYYYYDYVKSYLLEDSKSQADMIKFNRIKLELANSGWFMS